MKILDRYLTRNFARLYGLFFLIFLAIFIVIEVSEILGKFLDYEPYFFDIPLYFLYGIPYTIVLTSPVVMLLAGLFLMQQMDQTNEITAIRGAGISIMRMARPLFIFAFGVVLLVMALGEVVVPYTEEQKDYIKNVKIYKRPQEDIKMRSNIQYKDTQARLYYIGFLDGYCNQIRQIDIAKFKQDNTNFVDADNLIEEKINAEYAEWRGGEPGSPPALIFHNGYIRRFSEGKQVYFEEFIQREFPSIDIQPTDLFKVEKDPLKMDFFELSEYIDHLKSIGEKHQRELVELHLKISFPFTNLIILLFCLPLAGMRGKERSRGLAFVIGIATCFVYLSAVRLGQSLGYNEIISPILAAWLANIIFAAIGIFVTVRAGR
ncbi:MAG: LptF/LptG family permease [Candidatus Cloacimonadia bacterium]